MFVFVVTPNKNALETVFEIEYSLDGFVVSDDEKNKTITKIKP